MFENLKKIFSSKSRIGAYILIVILAAGLWSYTTDVAVMFGNYGSTHTWIDILLSWIVILGFPLFLVAFWYKSHLFGRVKTLTKESGTGLFGGILATIISGASCCGATLAASFGLVPLMAFLPYDGLELKVIATVGLIYALTDILRNLEVCTIRKRK